MNGKRHRSLLVIAATLLVLIAAIGNRPLRIWYHRVRLYEDQHFQPVLPRWRGDPRYWVWRIWERGRSADDQAIARGSNAWKQIRALTALGYYAHRELFLSIPIDQFPPGPQWLGELTQGLTNRAEFPVIHVSASSSNTIQIGLTGRPELVQQFERVVSAHAGR